MPLQIILQAGREYEGLRRFAIASKDTDPKAQDTTPKLLIETTALPRGFDVEPFSPDRIPSPAIEVAEISSLMVSSSSRAPFGIEVKMTVREAGILLTGTITAKPTKLIEYGGIGDLNPNYDWQLPGFVFDGTRRHRCEIIISEILEVMYGPSEAFKFTQQHYQRILNRRSNTRP